MTNKIRPTRRANVLTVGRDRSLTDPVMASYDGVYAASFRYPQFSLDKLLAQKGWQLPEDMLTMAACRAPFNLKRYAILADGWQIVAAVTDPMDTRHTQASDYANMVRWTLNNIVSPSGMVMDFQTALFELLRGCWEGFRVSEIGYRYLEDGPYAGMLGYQGFYAKRAKQIGFDIDQRTNQLLHITSYTPGAPNQAGMLAQGGIAVAGGYNFDVPVERCALYTYNPDAGLPYGMGDWRGCYKHWWALDNIARFWVKALERWGSPVLVAEVGSGNTIGDVAKTMDGIRDGASAALPPNVKAQIVQAATGVFDGYRLASMYHEQQIAKNIQCNTLTTGEGQRVGSMALGEVHQDTGDTVYDFVRRNVEGVVNTQIIQRWCVLNIPGFDTSLCPRLSLGEDEVGDLLDMMQAFDIAIKDGVIWKGAKFIRDKMGWPPLDADEEKAIAQEQKAQQEAQQQLADAKLSNRANAMNDHETARALAILTRAFSAQMQAERQAA